MRTQTFPFELQPVIESHISVLKEAAGLLWEEHL